MTHLNFPTLDKGFVRLVTEPDSDLKVVNAARVSFHKTSQWVEEYADPAVPSSLQLLLHAKDQGLIRYLARHRHWTPFAHCTALMKLDLSEEDGLRSALDVAVAGGVQTFIDYRTETSYHRISLAHVAQDPDLADWFPPSCAHSLRELLACTDEDLVGNSNYTSNWRECPALAPVTLHFKMPIFVARQFMRSNVGIVYNEMSRRYVDDPPEFYVPEEWRGRPDKAKQGSQGIVDVASMVRCASPGMDLDSADPAMAAGAFSSRLYDELLEWGVAPEMARIVLPVSQYTEFWATMDLQTAARVYALREDSHAQWEIQEFARSLNLAILQSQWAEFWPAIRDNTLKEFKVE